MVSYQRHAVDKDELNFSFSLRIGQVSGRCEQKAAVCCAVLEALWCRSAAAQALWNQKPQQNTFSSTPAHRCLAGYPTCPRHPFTVPPNQPSSMCKHPLSPARWASKPAALPWRSSSWGGVRHNGKSYFLFMHPREAAAPKASACHGIAELERLDMMEQNNSSCTAKSTETGRLWASNTRPQKQDWICSTFSGNMKAARLQSTGKMPPGILSLTQMITFNNAELKLNS